MLSAAVGPFAISAANERRSQDCHVHHAHGEIYVSTSPMRAEYHSLEDSEIHSVVLEHGGVMVFAPGVVHKVTLGGLTIIVEAPALIGDKKISDLSATGNP